MEDIRVESNIDLKTYFKISMLAFLKSRLIIFLIALALISISYVLSANSDESVLERLWPLLLFIGIYIVIMPLMTYLACRRNMKSIAYLREAIVYTINNEKIEYIGETVSAKSNWQYVKWVIERQEYFMIMLTARSFHYLPKNGFESDDKIVLFRILIKEKGLKLKTS